MPPVHINCFSSLFFFFFFFFSILTNGGVEGNHRRRALNTGVTFFSGVEADRKKKGRRGKMRMWRREPERRSTGIEIPERNSSRFLLLVAVSTRVVSSHPPHRSRLPLPLSVSPHFSNPSPDLGLARRPTNLPAFSPFLSNIRLRGWANGQSVDSPRSGLIYSTEKGNLAFGDFSTAKKSGPTAVHLR